MSEHLNCFNDRVGLDSTPLDSEATPLHFNTGYIKVTGQHEAPTGSLLAT